MNFNRLNISPFSIIAIFSFLGIAGLALSFKLNVELKPNKTLKSLNVNFQWPNTPALVIEHEATSKLEGLFNSVRGVESISSISKKGFGSIDIDFKDEVDVDMMRFEVANLIRQIYPDLPLELSYPEINVGGITSDSDPLLTCSLIGSKSIVELEYYANQYLIDKFSDLKGIDKIRILGGHSYSWEIRFKSELIKALDISPQNISTAVSAYFREEYAGIGIYQENNSNVTADIQVQSLKFDSLNWRIPIKLVENRMIYLTDISTIQYKEQKPISYFRINGLNTLSILFFSKKEVNKLSVAAELRNRINLIQQSNNDKIALNLAYDSTAYLSQETTSFFLRSICCLSILLLLIRVVYGQMKYVWIAIFCFALNLTITCLFYYILKLNVNIHSLPGLSISFAIELIFIILMIYALKFGYVKEISRLITGTSFIVVSSLSMVFIMRDVQESILDLITLIILNLIISSIISTWLLPAIFKKFELKIIDVIIPERKLRLFVMLNKINRKLINFLKKSRWSLIFLLVLSFGLPLNLLPTNIKGEGVIITFYNNAIGDVLLKKSSWESVENLLGGSIRLFIEYVVKNPGYSDPTETILYVNCSMPEGSTMSQTNETILKMEGFLKNMNGISLFETSVYSYRQARITIHFKNELHSFSIKNKVESMALSLGGSSWTIYGVGNGFSNIITNSRTQQIEMIGYNYDQLYSYASKLKEILLKNNRVSEVTINSKDTWASQTLYEYSLNINKESVALKGFAPRDVFNELRVKTYREFITTLFSDSTYQNIFLLSDQQKDFNVWSLKNEPFKLEHKEFKLANEGYIDKMKIGSTIYKKDQQYYIMVEYDYTGPINVAEDFKIKSIDEIQKLLALGYSAEPISSGNFNNKTSNYYLILFFIVIVIYLSSSIFLESLFYPLVIVLLLPVTFIGTFLSLYFFEISFGQGVMASILIVGPLSASSYITLIYEFKKRSIGNAKYWQRDYLRSFNSIMLPILWGILSSLLVLLPLVAMGKRDLFWFSFAVGTIGGLLFSIVGLFIFVPVFISFRKVHSS